MKGLATLGESTALFIVVKHRHTKFINIVSKDPKIIIILYLRSSNSGPSTSKSQSVRPEMSYKNGSLKLVSGNNRSQQSLSEQIMEGAMNARRNSPPSSSASSEGNDDAAMAVIMSLLEVGKTCIYTSVLSNSNNAAEPHENQTDLILKCILIFLTELKLYLKPFKRR